MEYDRELPQYKDPKERIKDYAEFYLEFGSKKAEQQAARCMDCGVPFCHNGCPLGNIIPEFNDAVYHKNWQQAYNILSTTNNFPEFTGRICPAPCEASCVLGIIKPPVTIENIEKNIIERAYEHGWVKPNVPEVRTGKKVAVVGSGPSGLACAAQLNKAGHAVTVFERADRIGGLLRYGIPDFKLMKKYIDRRVAVMEQEGIVFKTNANVGGNIKVADLMKEFDAIALCGGSTVPRDLPAPGRQNKGVHFAMDFLGQNNKRVAGDAISKDQEIFVKNAHVIVIGGGDTGSDCVGTSIRHGAKSVTQIELLPKPKLERGKEDCWPNWPNILRTSSSHEEGCERFWSINTKEFIGENGVLKGLKICDIEWEKPEPGKRPNFKEVPGSERVLPADYIFLAMGFVNPQHDGMLDELAVAFDERGNVKAIDGEFKTSVDKVFAAGDMRRGQSLVVWAISEGRECARKIDTYLMGDSQLESKSVSRFSLV